MVIRSKKCASRLHKLLYFAGGVPKLACVGENVSPNVQYSLFAVFCLALGFAAFSLVREQSKMFGTIALIIGAFAFISPSILFLWFPGMLRH